MLGYVREHHFDLKIEKNKESFSILDRFGCWLLAMQGWMKSLFGEGSCPCLRVGFYFIL